MPLRVGNDFLMLMIERGLIPEHALSVAIRLSPDELPTMIVESFMEDKDIEFVINCIESTEQLINDDEV